MFCAEETFTDEELFERNVIVDLSRVGSMETKSLLMGILVMKLEEHRMCSDVINGALRHVTVLEEAHNLLRRTSEEQAQEGANLQGKSVEMLANAIAEMRTYGEGFIIADQAPGLLDPSVIRNTNTKIVLRLPDEEDRRLVGKSAALKEEQVNELARLPLGVAVVYQNNWQEAVLCEMDAYPIPQIRYQKPKITAKTVDTEFVFSRLAQAKLGRRLDAVELEQLKQWFRLHRANLRPEDGSYLERLLQGGTEDVEKTRKIVFNFFGGMETVLRYIDADERSYTPRKEILNELQGRYELSAATAEWVLNNLMTEGLHRNPDRRAVEDLRTNFEQQGGRIL